MDERFARVLKDPRFKRMSKTEKKVKIDSRFEKMFSDDRFHTKFTVDKRGKPIHETEKEDLNKFYEIESGDEQAKDQKDVNTATEKNVKLESSNKKLARKSVTKSKNILPVDKKQDLGDGKTKKENSFIDIRGVETESDSDSELSNLEIDLDDNQEDILHGWGELDEDAKRIENAETSRVAVCNCDWDKINATDLFILFHSFKPTGGAIKCVTIYPSDYGIERMKEEDLKGPQELKETLMESDDETGNGDDNGEGSRYHMEKLREYQLNRMKYYYAVVECDSKNTANTIYEECDGMEYEMSATRLDLRFIPEETVFENPPKAVCNELPNIKNYQPSNFLNTALQQSTVRLTWDETDPKRLETTMKKFSKDDLENMDFKDYLASSSGEDDDDDCPQLVVEASHPEDTKDEHVYDHQDVGSESENDDDEERIKKYRLLMKEIEASELKEKEGEEEGNMEMTWIPGMNAIGEQILQQKTEDDRKDKKTKKIAKETKFSDLEQEHDNEDDTIDHTGFDDPFFDTTSDTNNQQKISKTKKKKKKRNKTNDQSLTEEEKKKKEELELLLMDETADKKHFNLKTILDQSKVKSKKKLRKRKGEEIVEDAFELDVKDSRFDALYSSHLYALDPADTNFKKTKATEAIVQEKQKRREQGLSSKDIPINNDDVKIDSSISALVKSVKSKTLSHQSKKRKRLR